jgi:hypothetical protein
MFKTISAALLAVSVLAAPALAASSGKTDAAPVTKQAPAKTTEKTTDKTAIKPGVANANAKMSGHHMSHHKLHQSRKVGALKTHSHKTHTKVSLKQVKPVSKRG